MWDITSSNHILLSEIIMTVGVQRVLGSLLFLMRFKKFKSSQKCAFLTHHPPHSPDNDHPHNSIHEDHWFPNTSSLLGSRATWSSVPLEVHMVPLSVVDLLVDGPGLGGAWAHVQQQVQVAVQHLDGKEVHLQHGRQQPQQQRKHHVGGLGRMTQ